MSIYTIGDLHLSFKNSKPMDIFGDNWKNHEEKIRNNWNEIVKEGDLVILPGDFSWEMKLEDTYEDFRFLESLPGKKILLKGNHDYWWTTVKKMNTFLEENNFSSINFLFNNSYEFEDKIIVGTRGWNIFDVNEDKKMIKRELQRLELSIKDALEKHSVEEKEIIVFMHYPPISRENLKDENINEFQEIMYKYNIKKCIYAHLHGESINDALQGNINGIEYILVSADALYFKLYKVN